MKLTEIAACAWFLLASSALGQEPAPMERWDRVVALQTKHESSTKHATAFLVRKDEDVYLVTAHHAAGETNGQTRLLYLAPDGQSRWLLLRGLFPADANPWSQYKNSDLAVARLEPSQEEREALSALRPIALPFDSLAERLPPRTTQIELVGFPMALGATPPISAIVIPGNLVSRELNAETKWGREPAIFATPAVGSGTSGGPVFVAGDSQADCAVIGMCVGVAADGSGGKLSKLVPARIIRTAIENQSDGNSSE